MKQLGDILLEAGVLTGEQLAVAVEEQRRLGRSLGRVLVDRGSLTEGQLVAALAQQIGLRLVDLSTTTVDPEALRRLPEELCRRHVALPIAVEDGRLVVAMADPASASAVQALSQASGCEVRPVVATRPDVLAALDRHHPPASAPGPRPLPPSAGPARDASAAGLVDRVLALAMQERAATVHLEPDGSDLRVRLRVDGALREVLRVPVSLAPAVGQHLRHLAGLEPADGPIPEQSRLTWARDDLRLELTLLALPVAPTGERIVLRVLSGAPDDHDLAAAGFGGPTRDALVTALGRAYGMVLVAGPAGSGRSRTLRALGALVAGDRDVLLVGGPGGPAGSGVQRVPGPVEATALRAVLRSDADVVLLDDLPNGAARVAVDGALAGPLVVATLPAVDAASALVRLTASDVDPVLAAAALDLVLAQRLVRRLCACREPVALSPDRLQDSGFSWSDGVLQATAHRAVGCPACAGTGYRGRVVLHELLRVTGDLERLVGDRAPREQLERAARVQGSPGLREDGLALVLAGVTSLEEVARVLR